MKSDLMGVNFNALRTLQTVYRLGSISAAAEALDLQQPSVSYTIDRLRNALDDPLFLRQGRGIAPTQRCLELMPVVDRILKEADHLGENTFDPATTQATFKMVVTGLSIPEQKGSILRSKKGPLRLSSAAPWRVCSPCS